MTKLSPAVIAATFLVYVIPLQAQVKDTYQDQSNALTTIVVKEDSASDMAILQQQFDLEEIGMHQVIRITTRPNVTPKPEESRIDNPVMAEESIMIAQAEPNSIPMETPVLSSPAATQREATTEEATEKSSPAFPVPKAEAVTQKSQRSSSSPSGSSTRSKSSQKQTKVSNKRFKKEKRKRVSKRNNREARCYKF